MREGLQQILAAEAEGASRSDDVGHRVMTLACFFIYPQLFWAVLAECV